MLEKIKKRMEDYFGNEIQITSLEIDSIPHENGSFKKFLMSNSFYVYEELEEIFNKDLMENGLNSKFLDLVDSYIWTSTTHYDYFNANLKNKTIEVWNQKDLIEYWLLEYLDKQEMTEELVSNNLVKYEHSTKQLKKINNYKQCNKNI